MVQRRGDEEEEEVKARPESPAEPEGGGEDLGFDATETCRTSPVRLPHPGAANGVSLRSAAFGGQQTEDSDRYGRWFRAASAPAADPGPSF